jgi:cobalt-zinc-cadmium resistance protein CzcA
VFGEYGQINSSFSDNRFGISQSFNFPAVYINQKNLLSEEWKAAVLNTALKEAELKKLVRQVYYAFLYLKAKENLLLTNDSMYAQFEEKARIRFSSGESNILEKTTAETQRGAIAMQLKQVQQDLEIALLQFRLVINTTASLTPELSELKLNFTASADNNLLAQHPTLKLFEQQKRISAVNRQLEKSRLFPDLQLGYYNMSMKGTGADNTFYTGSTRFQSLQVGIGIPLFFGAQKAKINASKIGSSIAENNYTWELRNLETNYQSLLNQYQSIQTAVAYYENTALKNAQLITEAAGKQFARGELNYLEWVMLSNQAISIRSAYVDALRNYNETIIQINYLMSK